MLQWWRNRQQRRALAQTLYAATMAAARRPALYTHYGIPDTFDGRFDSLILHAAPVFTRLHDIGTPESQDLAQAYFDVIFKHMEISLREIGVGDLGVPRHVKKMMMAAQGQCLTYGTALQHKDMAALEDALRKNIYATAPASPEQITALATIIQQAYRHVSQQDLTSPNFAYPEGETSWPKAA